VHIKCENEQRTGSFKVRGALVRLSMLSREERGRGVVAASAGNHALGLAWACRFLGIPALVVVPERAAPSKLARLREMAMKVRVHGASYDLAEVRARQIAVESGATFVSPFDDPWVIAGNGGTIGLEIAEQLPECDTVLTPVGGGGLAAGLGIALPEHAVVGANSAASPAMARSLAEGLVYTTWPTDRTIAEGLEGGVSPTTAALCAHCLHSVEVVSEESIASAMRLVVRGHAMVVEGSAAAGVALLLERKPLPGDGPICVVVTGRNVEPIVMRQAVGRSGRATAR
jgi:threonine dehydratase